MRIFTAKIKEMRLDTGGERAAWINCPPGAIPAAGQYVCAHSPDDETAVLGAWLFPGEISTRGFLAIPPIPDSWNPGTQLKIWGPVGQGFKLPDRLRRLVLVGLDRTTSRLLPLIESAVGFDCSVTLFTDGSLAQLPSSVEVYPLVLLPEALSWAEFIALDVPLNRFADLRTILGVLPGQDLPCPAQVLLFTSMPCSGLADCGVCAVSARRGWKLVCRDGPVFALNQLEW